MAARPTPIICVLLLCFSLLFSEVLMNEARQRWQARKNAFPETDVQRKRCSIDCVSAWTRREGVTNFNNSLIRWLAYSMYDLLELEANCKSQQKAMNCFKGCGPHSDKEMITKPIETLNYICQTKYADFLKHRGCFADMKRETERCGTNQCDLQKLVSFKKLNKLCKGGRCLYDCLYEKHEELCGNYELGKLQVGYVKHILRTMNNSRQIFPTLYHKMQSVLPECEKLAIASGIAPPTLLLLFALFFIVLW